MTILPTVRYGIVYLRMDDLHTHPQRIDHLLSEEPNKDRHVTISHPFRGALADPSNAVLI